MRIFALLVLPMVLLVFGCDRPAGRTFSVMSYNVHQYGLMDRDNDGEDDPKPVAEQNAVVQLIARENPDVLFVQEMGDEITFDQFRRALRDAGVDYAYSELLRRGSIEANLALLSRFPIVSAQHHTNEWYSIGEAKVHVARGFLDVELQVTPTYRFRLLGAHLKSKVFSPLGQTEMRRNEARLLNKTVREIFDENPHVKLLVAGDMNDHHRSAPLREIKGRRGGELIDLRPADPEGDVWTCYQDATDSYSRFDYLFVNKSLQKDVLEARVVRDRLTYEASDHRPVIAVFQVNE